MSRELPRQTLLKGQVDPASPTTGKGSGKVRTTQEVLDHHLKAFAAGNLEDTLSDYAPDAIPTGF